MVCRINLRLDQDATHVDAAQNNQVTIYAGSWVKEGLRKLGRKLEGVKFEVWARAERFGSQHLLLESFTVGEDLTLRQLQMIARNEPKNTTGVITASYYEEDLDRCDGELVLSLKDLVRQTVIVALDNTVHFGGFPRGTRRVPQEIPVYVCDLSALQFQNLSNSGRLVIYRKAGKESGFLDDYIFENVVGERRKRFKEVQTDDTGRYVQAAGMYFDTVAYRRFVAQDVLLCARALNRKARLAEHKIHLKFLKYGTGHFAGRQGLGNILEKEVLPGVVAGLKAFYSKHSPRLIRSLEFPYYVEDKQSVKSLEEIKARHGIEYKFTEDDALKMTSPNPEYIIATTNCANPHAPIGNAIEFGSIDGAIANNLKTRGNILCPSLNKVIRCKFLDLD